MTRTLSRPSILVAVVASVAALGAAAAQAPLPKVGLSESAARDYALSSLTSDFVLNGVVATAVKALPPAARAQVVESGIAWVRAYVSSPAFASAYASHRTSMKPTPPDAAGSVDDEFKQKLAEQQKDLDEMRKNIAALPAEMRAEMELVAKQMEAMAKDPEMLKMLRMSIEMERADAKTRYEDGLRRWEEDLPAEPRVLVARRLKAFLDESADVDFAAALVDRNERKVFADARYEAKSSNWKLCYRVGKEATTAARAAAAAWLKELGAQ